MRCAIIEKFIAALFWVAAPRVRPQTPDQVSRSLALAVAFVATTLPAQVEAQVILYDAYDVVQNQNLDCDGDPILYLPSVRCLDQIDPGLQILPIRLQGLVNTRMAMGFNDGPYWMGRGLNVTASFGVSGSYGRLRFILNPMLQWGENRPFYIAADTSQRPPFQYPYTRNIDLVSRYGDEPYKKIFPGQSRLDIDLSPIALTLSTQNMRWGPAVYNPMMMSTNAGGFPHLRIGTAKPAKTFLGRFEYNHFWGLLTESDYFNEDPDDDRRFFTAFVFGWEPSFFDNLTIGLNRLFYKQTGRLDGFKEAFIAYAKVFPEGPTDEEGIKWNDDYDQIFSVVFDYHDKESRFRTYLEWARGDYEGGITGVMRQPEHHSGYTMGVNKEFDLWGWGTARFQYEHSSLATWETAGLRPFESLYAHHLNTQGYTQNGQMVGPGLTPGSQTDNSSLGVTRGRVWTQFLYQRIRHNDDHVFINMSTRHDHDIEHRFALMADYAGDRVGLRFWTVTSIRYTYLFEQGRYMGNVQPNLTVRVPIQ